MTKEESFLLDMLAYYTVDPQARRNYVEDTGLSTCKYAPLKETSEGCAIGRHLPLEVALEWDKVDILYCDEEEEECLHFESVYDDINSAIDLKLIKDDRPPVLKELNSVFLTRIQSLHDNKTCWDNENKSLSKYGKNRLSAIIDSYDMNKELFSQYL